MNGIKFDEKDGHPYRWNDHIRIYVSEWCILEDCMQAECHNCFPVKHCKKHEKCEKEGQFKLLPIQVKKK